ncbi:MAG TPA: TonB C-terminal domain-containing protein [Candidatus Acidoferrales bacterium]|nr:TonB C-terminal domain-containing protein [Candidatus Acidoferrales bacterium]
MIPRTLVPVKISPVEKEAPGQNGHRKTSQLDSRIVVPSELPPGELDARTSIPAYLPLDVLASRMLIPRDMPVKRMEESTSTIPSHVPLAVLETRVVVPPEAKLEKSFQPAQQLPVGIFEDVLEPDLFTTGEVNLLASPDDAKKTDWQWVARSFSLIVHVAVILFVLLAPKFFTVNQPAQQVQLARQQLSSVFLPPSVKEVPKIQPPRERPSDRIRLDPRILKKLDVPAQPTPAPLAGPKNAAPPQPEQVAPSQPAPQPPPQPAPKPEPEFKPIEPQPPPKQHFNLQLPNMSPGRELEQQTQEALQNPSRSNSVAVQGTVPGAGPSSGANGQGLLGAGVQILTPTDGVDFSNYLARLIARVKQNWITVWPISARMGDKGVVVMQFRIMTNGDMPSPFPMLERTSGKEPLDRAAGAALTESNPFEPLPQAYTRPYIELRVIFLYNLPLDYNLNQ